MSVLFSCAGLSQMNTQWQAAFFRKHNHAVHRVVVMAILFGFFLLFYFLSAHNGHHGLVATRKGQLLENSCYSDLGQEGACVKPDVLFSVDHPSVVIPITGARQVANPPTVQAARAKKKTKISFSCDSGDDNSQKPGRKLRRQHGPAPVGRQRQHGKERVDASNILPQRHAFMPRLRRNLVRNVLEKLRQPTLLALPVPPLHTRSASRSEIVASPSSARARCSSGVDAPYNGEYIVDTPGYASGASPQMHRHTERNRAVHGVEFQRKYRYNKHVAGFRGFRGFPPHLVTNRSSRHCNSRGIGPGPGITGTDVSTGSEPIPVYRYPGKHLEWENAKNPYLIRRRSFKKGPQRSHSSDAARKTSFADVADLTGDAFKRSYDNNPGIASVEARQGYRVRKSTPFVYGAHAHHIKPSTRSFSTMRTRRALLSDEFDVPRIDGEMDGAFTNPYAEFMRPVSTPNRGAASSNTVHSSSSRPHNGAREEREFRNIRSRANAAADRRSNGSSRGEDDSTTSESAATVLRNGRSSRDNTRVESGALARARANFTPRNSEVTPRDSTRFRTHTGGGPLNSDNRATIPVISLYPNDPYPSILDERTSRAYRLRSREGHMDLSYRLVPRGSFPDGGPDSAISRPFPGVLSPGRTSGRSSRNPTHMRLTASEARGMTLRIMNPWVGGSGSFSMSS